jgi:hypothetical protein
VEHVRPATGQTAVGVAVGAVVVVVPVVDVDFVVVVNVVGVDVVVVDVGFVVVVDVVVLFVDVGVVVVLDVVVDEDAPLAKAAFIPGINPLLAYDWLASQIMTPPKLLNRFTYWMI